MPYIKQDTRRYWEKTLGPLCSELRENPTPSGELNYLVTSILLSTNPQNYEQYNALIGVLESCKLEFYRRSVAVYEDQKIKENGDIF